MKTKPVGLQNVTIRGGFWGSRVQQARDIILPFQWEVMNDRVKDAAQSSVVQNFKIAAGEAKGEFHGYVFQDSDFGKWCEAVAYSLMKHPDKELEQKCDEVIALLEEAQEQDGYLNTRFMLKDREQRWTNVRDWHEMYVAGHLLEGAVAYYQATGKRAFLDVMIKNIDLINKLFGPKRGQKRGYPGHQEIELALVKLYRITAEKKYLELSAFFIDERGKKPRYFEKEAKTRKEESTPWRNHDDGKYSQSHLPVREQTVAVGHAVRAMYMYTGMTDVAIETGDASLIKALKILWDNVTRKQMYVIGSVGSTNHGEAFTFDYDLPNETAYTETCAAIGLVFWAQRMLELEVSSEYADVMERALYNGVISGVAQDGQHFFYQNPLASYPAPGAAKGSTQRPKWYGCACCPPNLARLLTSLGGYMYSTADKEIFTHLYANGTATIELDGQTVRIAQKTMYPWKETIEMTVTPEKKAKFTVSLRLPGWCRTPIVKVNSRRVALKKCVQNGYARLTCIWKPGDKIQLEFPMPVERIYANPKVRMDAGRVALQRGPVVFCLEEVDNGKDLNAVMLPKDAELTVENRTMFGQRVPVISARAKRLAPVGDELYEKEAGKELLHVLTAIPYFMWANREEGEMITWVREG